MYLTSCRLNYLSYPPKTTLKPHLQFIRKESPFSGLRYFNVSSENSKSFYTLCFVVKICPKAVVLLAVMPLIVL